MREDFNFARVVAEFRTARPRWDDFAQNLKAYAEHLTRALGVGGFVECRTKGVESFALKIATPSKRYRSPLTEVTDLVGLRIAVRTQSEVARVEAALIRQFEIDWGNSTTKAAHTNPSRFGYSSKHLIVKVRPELTPNLSAFIDMAAEIQLRTLLQHTWATVSRALGYKHETDLPEPERRHLYALSAMFELADVQLDAAWRRAKDFAELQRRPLITERPQQLSYVTYATFINESVELDQYSALLGANSWKISNLALLARDIDVLTASGVLDPDELPRVFDKMAGWGRQFLLDHYSRVYPPRNRANTHIERNDIFMQLFAASRAELFAKATTSILHQYRATAELAISDYAHHITDNSRAP